MKNNLLSAITIGISAMMVLQSPVSAYASENLENLDSLDNSNPGVTEEQAQPETPYEPITEDVQSAADTAIDACVSTPAAEETDSGEQSQPAQEQQAETNQVVAQQEVQQAADIILNGDSKSGTPSASEQKQTQEVKDLIEAATAVAQDSTDEEGNKVNSAVTSYEEAAKDIADAKENLTQAEEAKAADAKKAEEAKNAEVKKAEEAKNADAKKAEVTKPAEAGKKADTGGVPPDQPKVPEIDMTVGKDAPEEKKAPGEEVIDKIEDNWDKMNRKMSHLQQFWERPATQRTWERLKKILGKWLKHLKPTKAKVDMHFGFTSPATTGSMLGYMARFYPLYGNWLTIYPDFYYKVFEAEGFVKGRIRIGTFAIPALFLYLRKDTRETIKLAKKI